MGFGLASYRNFYQVHAATGLTEDADHVAFARVPSLYLGGKIVTTFAGLGPGSHNGRTTWTEFVAPAYATGDVFVAASLFIPFHVLSSDPFSASSPIHVPNLPDSHFFHKLIPHRMCGREKMAKFIMGVIQSYDIVI